MVTWGRGGGDSLQMRCMEEKKMERIILIITDVETIPPNLIFICLSCIFLPFRVHFFFQPRDEKKLTCGLQKLALPTHPHPSKP